MIIPLNITRSVLLFNAYEDLDQTRAYEKEKVIEFFYHEWVSKPITSLLVTQGTCPEEYQYAT